MDLAHVVSRVFPDDVQAYGWKDSALYALGLGYGSDPLDARDLAFVYEQSQLAVPSQCVVLGHPGFWHRDPATGIDWVRLLHGEHRFEIHRPLRPADTVRARHRVLAVEDKGKERGAMLHVETLLEDEARGEPVASVLALHVLRGDGGCGSHGTPPPPAAPLPDGEIDRSVEFGTLPQAALIYRLSGDFNPLHVDPEVARGAGFDRPILQGLCTMGLACRAILRAYCSDRPERLRSMSVRFSRPAYPGETIRFEFYREGDAVAFRAIAVERGVVVLDRCRAAFA